MNINEAFRYQNRLSEVIDWTCRCLDMDVNTMKVSQKHLRNAANPEAQDEVIAVESEYACKVPADDLISALVKALEEKEKLCLAVANAKRQLAEKQIDLDVACASNQLRHKAVNVLDKLKSKKATVKKSRASDFKFNINGEQVPYTYNVEETSEVGFDQDNVKALLKSLSEAADKTSAAIELAQVTTEVVYTPLFAMSDNFEEIVQALIA